MQVSIEELLLVLGNHLIIDVRTPAEYDQAHIPGAINIPLFTNEQRVVIGTAYKQQSKEIAIKIGLDYFGPNMRPMVETLDTLMKEHNCCVAKQPVYLHCWRGGMRSAAVAWLFRFYGYEVFVLKGGYKSYRQWVLQQFEKDYHFALIGGYTGSGKTEILIELAKQQQSIIDLEGLAKHKGSAFGNLTRAQQPSQEMFENLLAKELFYKEKNNKFFWLEDESKRIGNLNIPLKFWETMRTKLVYFINIPFEARLTFILKYYASFEKERIADAIDRIKKRLGPLETKNAQNFLKDGNYESCFKILLAYYDKSYKKSLLDRDEKSLQIINIEANTVDEITNAKKINEMKPIKYLLLLFLVIPVFTNAQNIAGLYTGTLYNDTNKLYYKYEIAISEEKGKLSGFSHTWFILDDQQYFGVKKVKVKQVDGKIIVEDDELLSNNYPVKPAKNVRQLNILTLEEDGRTLSGPFTTNATKAYRPLTGFIQLERKGNYRQSALVPHLEELGKVNDLSFLQEPELDKEAIAMLEKEKALVKSEAFKTDEETKVAKQKAAADLALANQVKEVEKIKQEQEALAVKQKQDEVDKLKLAEENALTIQKAKIETEKKLTAEKLAEEKKLLALQAEKEAAIAKKNKEEASRIEKEQQTAFAKQQAAEKERLKQQQIADLAASNAKKMAAEKLAKELQIAKEKTLALQLEKEAALAHQQKLEVEKIKLEKESAMASAKQKENELQKSLKEAEVLRNSDAPAADLSLRTNVVQQTVEFTSDSLLLSLYDNGEVDGDTVSVIINGEIILAKQRLSTTAVKKTIYIPAGTDKIELIMYAESLGTIPPNTGLLIVRDGKKYYEVRFSGDMKKNAAIIFNRKKE